MHQCRFAKRYAFFGRIDWPLIAQCRRRPRIQRIAIEAATQHEG